jgi:hypothetical protein
VQQLTVGGTLCIPDG